MGVVLQLKTIDPAARPHIRIDGVAYALTPLRDMLAYRQRGVQNTAPRIGELLQRAALTEAEERELGEGLATLCALVLDAPPAVLEKLTDRNRVQVLEAWQTLHELKRKARAVRTRRRH